MRYIFLLILIVAIQSCTTNKLILQRPSEITYRTLLHHNESWQKQIKSLDGNARITLDTPEYSGNFSADILLNGHDSLLITITGPMGIRLGKVFIADQRFVFYNQVANQFMTGAHDDFDGTNFLQFPLEIGQLRNVFAAQDEFGILKRNNFKVLENAYYIETENGTLTYKIWFDKEYLHINKIEYYDGVQLLYRKEYDRFEILDGVVFPRRINFIRPDQQQAFSIYFSDLEINKKLDRERFTVQISDNAKQIDLSLEQ